MIMKRIEPAPLCALMRRLGNFPHPSCQKPSRASQIDSDRKRSQRRRGEPCPDP